MAKTVQQLREERAAALSAVRNNKLLNYSSQPAVSPSAEGEGAKATSPVSDLVRKVGGALLSTSTNPVVRNIGTVIGLEKALDAISPKVGDTSSHIFDSVREGIYKTAEGAIDFVVAQHPVVTISELFGGNVAQNAKEFVERDHVGEWFDKDIYKERRAQSYMSEGGFGEGIAQGVGGMLPSVALAIATGGGSVAAQTASLLTTGISAAGNSTEQALNDGANLGQARAYGTVMGGLEMATEKLVGGGLDKVFGGGWFDNVLPSVGQWAKTGVGRYVVNAAGEGLEEVGAELADPLAKTIYKGKDALEEYKDLEYWKGVGQAGLSGAAISSIYGGAFDVAGGGVKAADIDSLMKDVEATELKGLNLQDSDKLDTATEAKLKSRKLGDLQVVEKILKSLPESKRAEIIESRRLSDRFEADGSLKNTLDGDGNLRYNKKYYSYTARGSEQKIADGLSDMSYDVAQKYAKSNGVDIETAKEAVGEFRLYDQELTDSGSKAFTKFKKGLSYLNKRGGINVDFAVVEPNSSFNGALKDGVLYIGADTFENGKWAGTLVHEYMHVEEGTPEYEALVKHLEADESLFDSALTSVLGKSYGFDINRMRDIGRRISENPDIYQTEIDSERKVQYAKKRRDPLLNNVFPMYEPFSKSGSEANRLAIDWVHRKDTKTGDQALISYHDRWYLIQKFDDSDLGYVIQRRVLKAEYEQLFKEIKEYGENEKIISLQGGFALHDKRDKSSYSLKGRGTGLDSTGIEYGQEDRSVVRVASRETDGGERDRRDGGGDSSGSGAYQSRADLAVNQEELSEYIEFVSEVSAHMGELLLGTESFIDKIVRTDASLAEKILGKISDLKEAFGRIGDPEAQAQHKRLVDAEKLYLDAIEAAGKKYENGKIISVYDDEDEGKENIVQTKYSFAGEKAQTADNMSLENAQRMLAGGIDSEIIRKETGWFKGYDGKWRFEIDDSDAYLVENPKFENRNDGEGGYFKVAKLGDVFTHDALYKAYPELKDYTVVIQDTETGTEGMTFLERKQIVLSKTLFERITKEYNDYIWGGKQKEIAEIEATPEYLEMDRYYDDDVIEEMDGEQWLKETELARDKFFSSDLGKRYYKLKWGDIDIRKFEPGWSDKAKMVLIHEIQHAIQHIEGFARGASPDYWARKVQSGYDSKGKTPGELYGMTAGEVEARDAGNRVDMTAEQRKNTRPDIDRSDVVFAYNSAVAKDFVGWTVDHNEIYKTTPKTMSMSDADRKIKFFNDFINDFRGRTAKFERNGHVYYAQFDASKSSLGKLVYEGKDPSSKSSDSGYRAKIRMLADGNLFELVEDTPYYDTEPERGKNKKSHKNAKHWDYYVKTIIVDGKAYDVMVNIRIDVINNDYSRKEEYVYSIRFRDNKTVATSLVHPATSKATSEFDITTNNSISQISEKSTSKGKFSFKEESSDNKNTADSNESKQSDNKKPTSYTKAEAEAMVDGIMESIFSFDGYHGEIKNRADVIRQAHAMLNSAEAGKRHSTALKFADYIIQHTALADSFDYVEMSPYIEKVNLLKPYLHRLNLDNLKGEIKYHYDKDTSPYLRWSKRKGEQGIGVDVMAMELEEEGYILSSKNPADMFFEIDKDYRDAVSTLKQNAKTAVSESFSKEDLKKLRNDIAKSVMNSFDERDFSLSKMKQLVGTYTREVERLRAANDKLKREAFKQTKAAERAIAKKNDAEERARKADEARRETEGFAQAANRVLKLVRDIKNWKSGVFESAAEANGDVFKGIIGKLSKIEIKGNISATAARKVMREMAGWYGASDIYPIVKELKDADLWDEGALEAMKAIGDDKKIEANAKLTKAELGMLESVIRNLKHVVESYHRVFRAGKYIDAKPLAEEYIRIIGENAKIRAGRVARFIDSKYYENFGDVESLMKWHDRYNKGGFLTATFNELREGALNMAIAQMQMRAELDAFIDKNSKFLDKISKEKIEVEGLEMTRAEAISLYMTAKREHAEGGIAIGGFEIVDKKTGQKHGVDGLVETEYKAGNELELDRLQGLVGKLQNTLYSQFSEKEKQYIAVIERILNHDCKQRKHNTDILRLGYSNTVEDYYYPIRRGHLAQKVGEDTLGAELGRIKSLSFNQNTVKGTKGRLLIEPVNEVVDRHIAGIAMYENISIPIDNFNRLFNLDISGNKNHPTTIATALSGEGGWAEAGKYIDKLIKDIEGIKSTDKWESKALGFIRSGFVKFQLGANPKTWVTQLSSLFASMSVIDPKYVGAAMSARVDGAELDEYSALAKLRNRENTAALAQGVVDRLGKVGDALMKPIGWTDRFVVTKLWYACQLQVEAEQKLKLGSGENKVAAAKLLEKVIFETQQNSLLTERSAAMRSSSELIKGFTMFSSDAMKLTARIVDAYGRVNVIKEKLKSAEGDGKKALEVELKEATGEFKRASGSAIAVAAFMSLIALAFSAFYGKRDDDETFAEAAKTFGADFAGNLLGGLPLIRDIYSYLADGYELNHYAISYVNDLLSGVNGMIGLVNAWIGGENITKQQVASKTKAALFGIGQLFGIPLRNAYNVGRGVFGSSGLITGNGQSFGYAWDALFYDKSYSSDLNKAIEAGDDKLVARISSLMVGESFDGVSESVAKELRELVATGANVLPRAVGDSITYDGEEYAFTLRQRKRFEDIYGTADEVLADLVKLKQYKSADDAVKARAVKFIYETYYDLAVDDMLGVDSADKNVLFAEAIDIEKLAIIVAQARSITADKDRNGKAINGTKKTKIIRYIESLALTAVQKHMIYGYLGYRNSQGEDKVKAYINRLKLTVTEKKALLRYSGYAA